ncbi:UNVERIFIED_CONTAM: RuvA C-terminal domain-containing protein [Campylobacter lari]
MINQENSNKTINEANKLNSVKETLKVLGFKQKDIDKAVLDLKNTQNVELMVEDAIKIISTMNYENSTTTTSKV